MDGIAVPVKHRRRRFSGVRGQFVVMVSRRGVDEPDLKPSRKSSRCSLFAAGGFLP